MQVNRPSGNSAVTLLQVVAARADQLQCPLRIGFPSLFRRGDLQRPGEIGAGQGVRVRHNVVRRSLGDDLAAVHARARPDIDDIIGGEDRVLIVLDHDHRIAEVAQPPQRLQQPDIVALVQADRGLVQHVEHAGEARADLRGQADALAFAAGKRARPARKREIVQPDIDQEFQPVVDLAQDARGDLVALGVQLPGQALNQAQASRTESSEISPMCLPVDLDRQRLGLEPEGRRRRRRALAD